MGICIIRNIMIYQRKQKAEGFILTNSILSIFIISVSFCFQNTSQAVPYHKKRFVQAMSGYKIYHLHDLKMLLVDFPILYYGHAFYFLSFKGSYHGNTQNTLPTIMCTGECLRNVIIFCCAHFRGSAVETWQRHF